MKFRLAETTQRVDSDYILSLLSNKEWKASGFFAGGKHSNIKQKLLKALDNPEEFSNYHVHHINGLHPSTSQDENNNINNLAFIPKDIHKQLTQDNKKIVEEVMGAVFHDANIGSAVFGIITYCLNKGIDYTEYISIDVDIYNQAKKQINDKIVNHFNSLAAQNKDVISLDSLMED